MKISHFYAHLWAPKNDIKGNLNKLSFRESCITFNKGGLLISDDFINKLKNGTKLYIKIIGAQINPTKKYSNKEYNCMGEYTIAPNNITETYYAFDLKGSSKALQF